LVTWRHINAVIDIMISNENVRFSLIMLCTVLISQIAHSQHKQAYQLFDSAGVKVDYYQMLDSLRTADVVLFGELHNSPICHWLEHELLIDLDTSREIILGMEMFERDNQEMLNWYLNDSIDYSALDSTARLWSNYETDYMPIIEFAKSSDMMVVASNVPRRYATQVYQHGIESLDSLSDLEKEWIAPLPMAYDSELPGYKSMMDMFDDPSHANENLPKAQALKDATMAHSILSSHKAGQLIFHLNGSYHSNDGEGIIWYLKQAKPKLKIYAISSEEQANIDVLDPEYQRQADFLLVVPETMTKSY